jgi:septal ring factor EnvC (AmiA/AmiB activator)
MKNIKIHILLFSFILVSSCLVGQSKKDLENKKRKTLEEINFTNELLKQAQNNRKESYNSLLLISNKISIRHELINDINNEIEYTNEKIKETEVIISMLEEDLKTLLDNYAKMVRAAWKNQNNQNTIMFVLSSEDFNQTYLRLKYMQQLAHYRKRQFRAINSLKDVLAANIEKLNKVKQEKIKLLNEEKEEERTLKQEQSQQEKTIQNLRQQEGELKKKLRAQQEQMKKLQREIEKLIAEEAKKTSGSSSEAYALTPAEKIISTNFGNNRGNIPWPVERGIIVSRFGKQQHPVLRGIEIDNKGVDISTIEGTYARAVFDGEVRKVFLIPGAQAAVIIRHGEYLSVYTHLEDVTVSVGENVKAKQSIGKIYTDKTENKTVLHLEFWKGNQTLNPSIWLAK